MFQGLPTDEPVGSTGSLKEFREAANQSFLNELAMSKKVFDSNVINAKKKTLN